MLVIRIIGNHVGQDALAEPHVVVVAQQHSQFAAQRGEQRGMLLRREVVQLVGIGRIVEHQHAFERPVAADTQLHRMRCGLHAARLGEEAADQSVGIAPAVEVAHVKGSARAFGLHELLLVPKQIVRKKYLFSTSQYFSRIILERIRENGGYMDGDKPISKKEIIKAKRFSGEHWQYDESVSYTKKNNDALDES